MSGTQRNDAIFLVIQADVIILNIEMFSSWRNDTKIPTTSSSYRQAVCLHRNNSQKLKPPENHREKPERDTISKYTKYSGPKKKGRIIAIGLNEKYIPTPKQPMRDMNILAAPYVMVNCSIRKGMETVCSSANTPRNTRFTIRHIARAKISGAKVPSVPILWDDRAEDTGEQTVSSECTDVDVEKTEGGIYKNGGSERHTPS